MLLFCCEMGQKRFETHSVKIKGECNSILVSCNQLIVTVVNLKKKHLKDEKRVEKNSKFRQSSLCLVLVMKKVNGFHPMTYNYICFYENICHSFFFLRYYFKASIKSAITSSLHHAHALFSVIQSLHHRLELQTSLLPLTTKRNPVSLNIFFFRKMSCYKTKCAMKIKIDDRTEKQASKETFYKFSP